MSDASAEQQGGHGEKGTGHLLTKKLNKILEMRLDSDKETLEALKELSTFFPENTFQARRNLRGQIERRSLSINQDFLEAFGEVKTALDSIYQQVSAMNSVCQDMSERLQNSKTQTHHLLEQTAKLQNESHSLTMKQQVASTFVDKFQLTREELALLRSAPGQPHGGAPDSNTVTPAFFDALAKSRQIHSDCQILLQSGQQGFPLEAMEQMAMAQEAALELLYRWAQRNCHSIEQPGIAAMLCKAMSCLQARPILLRYVLDEYAASRRALVVRGFIQALTNGGPGGTPCPIETHAHDPPRYVGDMLAWLHQAVPGEKENLQVLLKECETSESPESLGHIMEGVCRPLRVRLEQAIATERGPVMLYRVTNLLRFYHRTISGEVPVESGLVLTLGEVQQECFDAFLSALRETVSSCLHQGVLPANDLSAATGVGPVMNALRDVLAAAAVAQDQHQDFAQIFQAAVDPLLEAINENTGRLSSTDMAVFRLNCLYQIHSTLSLYEFMEAHLEKLQTQMESEISCVLTEQANWLDAHLGLGAICSVLQETTEPLSSVPGMEAQNLKLLINKLDGYLANPEALLLPQSRLLQSLSQRRLVQKHATEVVTNIYGQLHDAVHDPKNAYRDPAGLVKNVPTQNE